jgi:hypothetical protein
MTSAVLAVVATAMAQDGAGSPPPPAPPSGDPALEHRLDVLESEVDSLKQQLKAKEQDDLMREAEALAAEAPPPPPPSTSPRNAMNPQMTAFGDVITSVAVGKDGAIDPNSGPWLRSLEFDVRADVDPYAKAVAVFSLEQEDPIAAGTRDEFDVSPEEVYIDLVSLPAGFTARVGKFRQPFGLTNKTHPHDLPWTDVPKPVAAILGDEGYNDTGAVVSWHIPNNAGLGATLEGGALSGTPWDPDNTTAMPAWLGRGELFRTFGNVDVGIGASGVGLLDHRIGGADLMLRWKKNQWRSVTLMAEGLVDTDDQHGAFAALQFQPTRPLYLGVRADWLDGDVQAGGFVSYYTSEFLRVRVGAMAGADSFRGDAQLTFVWGSHPAEPYWVNR